MDIYLDVLSVVAECFAEDGQAANMFCVVVHGKPETETAAEIQMKAVDGHVRDLEAVDEGSFPIDHEQFKQAVLFQLGNHQSGVKSPLESPKSPGESQLPMHTSFR